MADNRRGVRAAYHAAQADKGACPTLDDVCENCPSLDRFFVKAILEREGKSFAAGSPIQRTSMGIRRVYDEPVQEAPGEAPVIHTRGYGFSIAYDVPYQASNGQMMVRTRDGIQVLRNGR